MILIAFIAAPKMATGCMDTSFCPRMRTNRISPLESQKPFPPASNRPINWSANLGLGAHVDHVLVRRAVDLLQRPLLYYLDVPYLFKTPEEFASNTAGMKANAHTVGEAGLKSWQEAISAYASQMASCLEVRMRCASKSINIGLKMAESVFGHLPRQTLAILLGLESHF